MPLVPADFDVPDGIPFDGLTVRLLHRNDLARHFEACMGSAGRLRSVLHPASHPPPSPDIRLALASLLACEWEHYKRTSFSYGVFDDRRSREVGCIYVAPTVRAGSDAELVTWVGAGDAALDGAVFDFAKAWLAQSWPFANVAYPGRGHPWAEFPYRHFVPVSFEIPASAAFETFSVRLLTMDDVARDHHAYMTNIDHIAGTLAGPNFSEQWPHPGIDVDLALADAGWSEWQHHLRTQFSYGVFTADGEEEVGCLYVSPADRAGYDAEVAFWFVERLSEAGIEPRFLAFVRRWLAEAWPFARPGLPGREITWEEWLGRD